MAPVPGIRIPTSKSVLKAYKTTVAKAAPLKAIKVQKAATGFTVKHTFDGLVPPKTYVFPNTDKLAKHLTHTARSIWLGNKTSTPKVRGSMMAHREKQVETTSY